MTLETTLPGQAAAYIRSKRADFTPKLAIILGSGLSGIIEHLSDVTKIPYGEIPGFPKSAVKGHPGELILGTLHGVPLMCFAGRVHLYEGLHYEPLKNFIRTIKMMGCEQLLITNAAGSLRHDVPPGSIVCISDFINFQGTNPLIGPNDDLFGDRFIGMSNAYDPELSEKMRAAAKAASIPFYDGIYCATLGPCFETPAEIQMFRRLGIDVVGMSSVPDTMVARHCGLRVVMLSAITNLAAGMKDEQLSHEHTLKAAAEVSADLISLVEHFVKEIA